MDIIVDFRGIPTMKKFGYPVIMDVTHTVFNNQIKILELLEGNLR